MEQSLITSILHPSLNSPVFTKEQLEISKTFCIPKYQAIYKLRIVHIFVILFIQQFTKQQIDVTLNQINVLLNDFRFIQIITASSQFIAIILIHILCEKLIERDVLRIFVVLQMIAVLFVLATQSLFFLNAKTQSVFMVIQIYMFISYVLNSIANTGELVGALSYFCKCTQLASSKNSVFLIYGFIVSVSILGSSVTQLFNLFKYQAMTQFILVLINFGLSGLIIFLVQKLPITDFRDCEIDLQNTTTVIPRISLMMHLQKVKSRLGQTQNEPADSNEDMLLSGTNPEEEIFISKLPKTLQFYIFFFLQTKFGVIFLCVCVVSSVNGYLYDQIGNSYSTLQSSNVFFGYFYVFGFAIQVVSILASAFAFDAVADQRMKTQRLFSCTAFVALVCCSLTQFIGCDNQNVIVVYFVLQSMVTGVTKLLQTQFMFVLFKGGYRTSICMMLVCSSFVQVVLETVLYFVAKGFETIQLEMGLCSGVFVCVLWAVVLGVE